MKLDKSLVALALLSISSVACRSTSEVVDAGPPAPVVDAGSSADAGLTETSTECPVARGETVRFSTDDGVALEGDLYTVGELGRPGVVLLHMVPPGNDRSNYPPAFIDALLARRLNVINVDRRGAGGSEGVAKEAYEGDKGKLDAKAARARLLAHACQVDPARVAMVGASNGTTSALDFTVYSAGDESVEVPAALVFLTGGTYTEKQNRISDHRAVLDPVPILFVYSDTEEAWSVAFQSVPAPPAWLFRRYEGGDHGTRMFSAKPESITDVAVFLEGMLQ